MKKYTIYIAAALFALTGCDRSESHVALPGETTHNSGAVIGLDITAIESAQLTDTHIYEFDASQLLVHHSYYPTQQDLSSDLLQLEPGDYTFIVVLNVGEHFMDAAAASQADTQMSLNTLFAHIKAVQGSHPNMLTGLVKQNITADKIAQITIPIFDGIRGIVPSNQTLTLLLPGSEFPEYQAARTKATEMYNLCGVVEFYQSGKSECLDRQRAVLTPTTMAGQYTMNVQMPDGVYDLLAWVDYTQLGSAQDFYYNTASLLQTKIIATDKELAAGGDSREMFCVKSVITISAADQDIYVTLKRPAAKYRLVANDVIRYKSLMTTNPESYPPLTDLVVTIFYEGHLPDGFNVSEGKPNSAETGYKYKAALPTIGARDSEVLAGCDFVLVNGQESSVSVTVEVSDKTGRKISRTTGVEIKYKRGMITTVTGQFLTAGVANPGINISTDWDGIYNVNFKT